MGYILPIIILFGLFHTVRIYLKGKSNKEQYPAVDYLSQSSENTDSWRWRKPLENLSINLSDDAEKSSLRFNPNYNSTDYFISAVGALSYLFGLGFAIFSIWFYFFGGPEDGMRVGGGMFFAFIGFIFGLVAHSTRQRLVGLTRTPSGLVLEYSYGTFFKRKVKFNNNTEIKMDVKEQSISDYDSAQEAPYYEFFIAKRKLISFTPVKFYIYVNPSQMAWLKGGMADWFSNARNYLTSAGKKTA